MKKERQSDFVLLGSLFVTLFVTFLVSGVAQAQLSESKNRQQNFTPCVECIRFRVGLPQVVRRPRT